MIGFVIWPPFLHHHYYTSGQVTKPNIVVKICMYAVNYVLYVIQVVKKTFDKYVISWPQLISKILVTRTYVCNYSLFLIGLTFFYTQGVFCLAYSLSQWCGILMQTTYDRGKLRTYIGLHTDGQSGLL